MPPLRPIVLPTSQPGFVSFLEPGGTAATPGLDRLGFFFSSLPITLALRFSLLYVLKKLLWPGASINFSQIGEDALIRSLLDVSQPGIYVDVGCNDPIHWSNTFSLYLRGWRGIAIDANPKLTERFQRTRRRDIAVCAAVSDEERDVVFHEFDNDLVSTLSQDVLPEWQAKWHKRGERVVKTRTLNSILAENLPTGKEISLLSVDVEGHDLAVLRSVNLDQFRPKLIIVEIHRLDMHATAANEVASHLEQNGFRQIAYDSLNGYFADVRTPRSGLRLA